MLGLEKTRNQVEIFNIGSEDQTTVKGKRIGVLGLAFKLRKTLNDFIDCLILSAAINHCDLLLTEDKDIQDLKSNKKFNDSSQQQTQNSKSKR